MQSSHEEIVGVVSRMFEAAGTRDASAFRETILPDMFIYENGERFSAQAIYDLLGTLQDAGMRFVWEITEPKVLVEGSLASVAYINRGSITDKGVTNPVTWLETATLVHEGGRWRVAWMSSMRAAATTAS